MIFCSQKITNEEDCDTSVIKNDYDDDDKNEEGEGLEEEGLEEDEQCIDHCVYVAGL